MQNKIKNRLFLDIHAIQTVPPANINRDDTGSPKTAQYGGVTRARVSSQSWKRAMRLSFPKELQGTRTKRILRLFEDQYIKRGISFDKDVENDMIFLTESLGFGIKESNDETILDVLFMYSNKQINEIIDYYTGSKEKISVLSKAYYEEIQKLESKQKKDVRKEAWKNISKENKKVINEINKNLEQILKTNNSVDTYLFGRMLAAKKDLSVDASSQVAHAISTHAIQSEFDFFTAVDDLAPEDNAGAGMLGTIEYNSSTLYRYANVALHEFYRQLEDKEETINATKLFVKSFVESMPTGKINTFANQTLPQAIVVSLRYDRPLNMVSAFEEPIKSDNGYVGKSIEKLFAEYTKYDKILDKPIFTAYLILGDTEVNEIGKSEASLNDLLEDLGKEIEKNIEA